MTSKWIESRRGNSLVILLPFIACPMNGLDPVKVWIQRPKLISDPSNVSVDRIALDQPLTRDVTERFIGPNMPWIAG